MEKGKDILGMFGTGNMAQASRPAGGGAPEVKPLPYSPPVGPKGIMDGRTPGLHGDVHPCGSQRDK